MLKTLRRKTIGDLKANWSQFLAVWLVVTLGTTFYGTMYPAAINLLDSIFRTYDQLRYLDFQVQLEPVGPEAVEPVRAIPGVAYVEGRLIVAGGWQVDPAQQYQVALRLISLPDAGEPDVNRLDITGGADIQGPGDILVHKTFADKHDIEPGDTLNVAIAGEIVPLRVAGLVFSPEYIVAGRDSNDPFPTPTVFGVAWMRYSDLAVRAGQDGRINDIVIRLEGKSEDNKGQLEDDVRAALVNLFPDAAVFSRQQTASGSIIHANINGNFPVMGFYSGMFLIGGIVITGILLARLVESERQRIGTMRAMGITRRELVLHYLSYGFLIGLTGGLVGSVLGYLNSFWFMGTFLTYIAGGTLPGFVNLPQFPFILLGLVLAVGGATLAGAYPAWTQSATPPGIALRPAAPKTLNAISRVKLGFLPVVVRQAVRNLLRSPGRAAGTALGVLAGSMMLFSALALWDMMALNFGQYFDSTDFDLRVDLDSFQSGEAVEAQMRGVEGVEAAQAALIGAVVIVNPAGDALDTIAVAVDETDPYFDLVTTNGADAFSSTDGVWIGHNIERVLGVGVGDTITVIAQGIEQQAVIRGIVSQVIGSPVFVPRSLMMEWTGGMFPVNSVLVRVKKDQDAAVREAVIGLPGVHAVTVLDEFDDDLNHFLQFYRINTLMFGGFGLILALALLYNTVNASLRERRDELAVLRALGTSGWEIGLSVTLEFLVMVVIGALIGVPLGRYAGYFLATAYDTDYFGYITYLAPLSYVVGLAGMLLVVLLAEIPGLRAVHKTDLGQVSKSQSF